MLEALFPLAFWRSLSPGQFVAVARTMVPSVGLRVMLKKEWESLTGIVISVELWNELREAAELSTAVPDLPSIVDQDEPELSPCDEAREVESDARADRDAALSVLRSWQDVFRRSDARNRRFFEPRVIEAQAALGVAARRLADASRARRVACQGA